MCFLSSMLSCNTTFRHFQREEMGHFSQDQTSPKNFVNVISSNSTRSYGCYEGEDAFTFYVVALSVASIGLPLTLLAIFALYSLVQKDHVAVIYVINLLITDLIQICCFIIKVAINNKEICDVLRYIIHVTAVMVSICFMVVISLERYLVVAWPLWYRFRRSIKTSLIVCFVVWMLPFLNLLMFFYGGDYCETTAACLLLLPFPLLIFFLYGTLKALSATRSVPTEEKRQIVSILVLVFLIYTLMFLPRVIYSLAKNFRQDPIFEIVTITPVYFSPLADLVLYVFMRKGIADKLLASLCCKIECNDTGQSAMHEDSKNSGSPMQTDREDLEKECEKV
uniref:G-protein coupled receptors family 1 profile domain-containing protein n=1 Tax=Oryzias sinensis TaxID=183150 RepID=A0A8C7Z1G9_9TELE